ncbi:MAG: LysR family transcriptional regulator [Legionellales bacterium]|nr:LysR family transcriptional regulator [Legionellales bacterium]
MNLYRINLNLLIALDILLAEKNVTVAAKKLFITQAAMSNNLQQLRELFKNELLRREKNQMVLTQYAKELQPKLHQVLQELHNLIANGQTFSPENSTRIFKISISDYMATLLSPKLLAHLKDIAPNIHLKLSTAYYLGHAEPFEQGEYDMGLGKLITASNQVEEELLFHDSVVFVVHPKHPLAQKRHVSLEDYLAYQHIAVTADDPRITTIIEQELAKYCHQRNIKMSMPYIGPLFKIIANDPLLIGTVIKSVACEYRKYYDIVIKELPFDLAPIGFHLVWHKRSNDDLGHQWLREQFRLITADLSQIICAK